ncbi:hypothetical protein [Advenella mimigardefordensis]|uniref:hypothetical protein n=1 Tax=Advenella mimigardefordensis TaxID=302406 RepID=UPI00046D936C|nr:hypothetical protein [Advenella mimigardefordensis]
MKNMSSKFFGKSLSSPGKRAPFVLVNPDGSVRMNLDNAEIREKFVNGVKSIKGLSLSSRLKSGTK